MAKDFFDELSDTITRTTKDLSKKAGQIYETQKIRSKISSAKYLQSSRACLKKAFCKMCVTICGRFCPDEGAVAGYGN